MKTYQAGQPVRWGIDASFDGYLTGFKNEPLMKEFYDLMRNIEEFGVQLAACNSVEWLGEEADAKAVRFMFNKMIKTGKGDKAKQYAPSIHFQVRPKKDEDGKEKDGEFWTDCKDEDGVAMPLSELPKNATVVMKIKLSSFYFIANKFGFTWDVKWVRVEGRAGERVDDYVPNLYGLSMPALPAPTEQTPVEGANKREHSADSEEAAAESNATESAAPPATAAGGKRVKRAA
jgi:hypothetical protein